MKFLEHNLEFQFEVLKQTIKKFFVVVVKKKEKERKGKILMKQYESEGINNL